MSALIKFISSIEKRYKTQHDNSPTLIIFAGTNGAGKSTLYESSEHYTDDVYIINPDVIAKKFACEEGFQSISKVPLNRQNVLYIKAGKEDKPCLVFSCVSSNSFYVYISILHDFYCIFSISSSIRSDSN